MNDYYKSIDWLHRTKSVQGISYKWLIQILLSACIIDIESVQNRLLKVCYVPAPSTGLPRHLFLLCPLTVLMKQTRQPVCAIKQSIYLDVYGCITQGKFAVLVPFFSSFLLWP